MMIHEKLMSGQFLLDFKKNRSSLLQTSTVAHQQQQPLHHLQSQSPTIPTLDIYSAYAYQQHLQQQLLGSAVHLPSLPFANHSPQSAEVLDLSRHNSAELPPKTPSPYQTSSSLGTDSPTESPSNLMPQPLTTPTATSLLPANLLYAAQVHQQFQNTNSLHIPANLATLYPGLYYPNIAKQEAMKTTIPQVNVTIPTPVVTNNNVLQTFASATAVAAVSTLKHDIAPEPDSQKQQQQENQQPQQSTDISTPTSTTSSTSSTISTSNMSSIDTKNTRPFKAFPRDPLVIAANFAATDVLLDNPRVERYTEYRKRVLEQIRSSNGGSRTVTNPKMRRTNSTSGNIHEGSSSTNSENDERNIEESSDCDSNFDNENQSGTNNKSSENSNTTNNTTITSSASIVKDAAYYERRRKNNAAAKKSRDRRRIKEDEIAIRAAYLERQNIELLCQIDALKAQLAALTSKIP